MKKYPPAINNPALEKAERLSALRTLEAESSKLKDALRPFAEINNHIHTIYSFSPYTPSMAALMARDAGLGAAGSVDHDSIAAADEMIAACGLLGIGGCVGFELRVSFRIGADGKPSPFAARKINNPDSVGYAYMTIQGIPGRSIPAAANFLAPLRAERLKRTRAMTVSANILLREAGFSEIDFERDVVARSKYAEGGGITERHLTAAIAEKGILRYGKGPELVKGLKSKLGVKISPKLETLLSDFANPHYPYDLLGILKSEFLPGIYIQPDENECIPAERVTSFTRSISAIPAYAYLGDVGESPTGDKKAEKFEDDFIEELFAELSGMGFLAVTYMPPRNTQEQLRVLRRLSAERGLMEISGVDINSSRQSFNCPEVLREEFRHLLDTTWALIAHERLASVDERYGIFSERNPLASAGLAERLAFYASLGKKLDLFHPCESAAILAAEIDKGRLI
jgi:hypothetical protein